MSRILRFTAGRHRLGGDGATIPLCPWPASRWADQRPLVRQILRLGKNVLGCVFILAGLAMLVLPGQGLLTVLVGFLLVDFPGKYRIEHWLLRRRHILRPINWLRRRARREPLRVMRSIPRRRRSGIGRRL
ncbi:MAG: PGPGW domain-containing protein [Planctomycetota bacterium]|nr:PGPGW domain-containing protein [Planctomycetota bacterium]